jgi:peroxiredoxin
MRLLPGLGTGLLGLVLGLGLVFGPAVEAGKFNKQLNVGDMAPTWEKLPGVDGKSHSLSDLAAAKAVVVIFTCNHCPVAQAYEERFKRLTADYRDRGVAVVAISVSRFPADDFPHMQQRAAEQGFNFAYLHDATQDIGRKFGATNTPQVFVLNAERKIAYMGAFDDSWDDADAVREPYVRWALEAVLSNKLPDITETRQIGCTIEYAARKP